MERNEKMNENRTRTFGKVVLWILILLPCAIRIFDTLYAFPYQDDFYDTATINELMGKGFSPFSAAISITVDKYNTYRGFFFSCFLYFFFDALLQCNIWGVRLFLFTTTTLFYGSLFMFVRVLSRKVLGIKKDYLIFILFFVFSCLNMTFFYPSNEVFYWLCSAEVTAIPMIVLFIAGFFYIKAIDSERKILVVIPILLGLLIGGATVNVAVFGCVVYGAIMLWGIISKRKISRSLFPMFSISFSGLINVLAPSNISSAGITDKPGEFITALLDSVKYVLVRTGEAYSKYPLIIFLTIALAIILLTDHENTYSWKFRLPGVFMGILFISQVIIIFPVILGYDSFIADWNENVINTVASSPDEIVRMEVEKPYEERELPDSQMHFGEYDPETEYTGNSAMAKFLGKEAIYI